MRDSGLQWGLGSDATAVTPYNPFYTLGWAVSGKMLGGQDVLRQTISREDALIAHTRSNAYLASRRTISVRCSPANTPTCWCSIGIT